jgi:hypothetical protein
MFRKTWVDVLIVLASSWFLEARFELESTAMGTVVSSRNMGLPGKV